MQQQAMQSGMIQNAVAQATQQAAAMAASDAVTSAMAQADAQKAQPTDQYVARAQGAQGGGPRPGSNQRPEREAPQRKTKKVTIEHKEG